MFKPGDKIIDIISGKIFTFNSYNQTVSFSYDSKKMIVQNYDYKYGMISIKEDQYLHYINNFISLKDYRKQKLEKLENIKVKK